MRAMYSLPKKKKKKKKKCMHTHKILQKFPEAFGFLESLLTAYIKEEEEFNRERVQWLRGVEVDKRRM